MWVAGQGAQTSREIIFDPFRLDTANQCLWRGREAVALRPKAFSLLHYLLEHAGKLVTKKELLDAVWPDTFVTDSSVKVCIWEIRKALGDQPRQPQFIKTMHRRGYRFIARTSRDNGFGWSPESRRKAWASSPDPEAVSFEESRSATSVTLVGREAELVQLRRCLGRALRGDRQVVFVTGEPGIGKTTLVEAFLERVAADRDIWIARGQCLEQYGSNEAYLPLLEAFGQFFHEPGCGRLITMFARHAPTWLVQMPSLSSVAKGNASQPGNLGTARERMLREMAEAVEALAAETPLVLLLEDLHWGDYCTLDLVSSLAQRRGLARLLLIATYRPVEVILSGSPLRTIKQRLRTRRQCQELPLELLTEEAVAEYLSTRFPGSQFPIDLTRLIYQRTDGNALFMVNVVDYLVAQGLVGPHDGKWELKVQVDGIEVGVPESIREMINWQVDQLGHEEQQVLEAASVAGLEFSAAAVAAALEQDVLRIEQQCEELAGRNHFIEPTGITEWPDGTMAGRYRFVHTLYQNTLYHRVAGARRKRFHQRIFG